MPSRKSNASETTLSSTSRRSSLRRLSSLASLQNLFTKRRSQNVSEHHSAVSSSSDLSASSSTASTTLRISGSSQNLLNLAEDEIAELPAPPATHSNNRRSSYICLPDDPIGGMPRSRTFSNLPIPSKAERIPAMNVGSHTHSRVQSTAWPSTRLPSPSVTTRKHSRSLVAGPPNRMKRSDTEPLLSFEHGYPTTSLHRSTAFKENISLSPIKPLPALDMGYQQKHYSSSPLHASQNQPPGAWISTSSDGFDVLSSSVPSTASYSPKPPPPISKYASHPAIQMVRDYKSSPAQPLHRSTKVRPGTPGGPSTLHGVPQRVQRGYSQPVLTNRTNHEYPPRRDSKHHKEIKPTRLLSAKQAPTPPPKTPLCTATGGLKERFEKEKEKIEEQTPTQPRPAATTTATQLTTYEAPAYWAGRLSALVDRYRNEELASFLLPTSNSASNSSTALTPKAQTDKLHTVEASTARLKRALAELESRCGTNEAKESLFAFQTQYAAMMNLPELKPPKLVLHLGNNAEDSGGVMMDGGPGLGDVRKASFMDRLLGKGKRRSLVLG